MFPPDVQEISETYIAPYLSPHISNACAASICQSLARALSISPLLEIRLCKQHLHLYTRRGPYHVRNPNNDGTILMGRRRTESLKRRTFTWKRVSERKRVTSGLCGAVPRHSFTRTAPDRLRWNYTWMTFMELHPRMYVPSVSGVYSAKRPNKESSLRSGSGGPV